MGSATRVTGAAALRRLWRSTLWGAAPGVAVLALLMLTGMLPWLVGLGAAAAVCVGVAALLVVHVRDMAALRAYLELLHRRCDGVADVPKPPTLRSPILDPELAEAVADHARAHEARRRELQASVNAGAEVLAGLPDPLLLLSGDGVIQRANPAAARLFGAQIEGRALATVLRHPDLLQAADEVLADGGNREVEFALPGEIERYVSARVAALPRTGTAGATLVITLHDVTAIRRAEQMRADFVANASHELRTPLSSLLGFIETLQGPARDDAEARERFLPIMLEQARRMANLIEDLLSLSRIELDEHTPPTGRADLSTILRRVACALELRAKAREMRIELDLSGQPLVAVGDRDQLTQVFQNLVDNAIKYGRSGTAIRVAAGPADRAPGRPSRRARRGIAVSVIDRGEGIPREHLPRLTQRFYRVDTARSRELGGTGLGLAIVKHIVNRHRGQLEIDSTPGQGSRFTVYLPMAEPQPMAHADGQAAE